MVSFLSESDVELAIGMPETIRIVEAVFRASAQGETLVLPRVSQALPGTAGAFRMLAAALPEQMHFGVKTLTGLPGKRLPGETYFVVMLFDMESGALRALISANHLTGLRTGAAGGVAASYLARADADSLGVIGSGTQAWYQVEALCAVRPVNRIAVFSPDREHARMFCRRVESDLNILCDVADSAHQAVANAAIIVTATTSAKPVLQAEWLRPGVHISAVGANAPTKRELSADCFAGATIVADSGEQVLKESGDLLSALADGSVGPGCIAAELSQVVAGQKPGRTHDAEITIFKSVGLAIQDVAVASVLFRNAEKFGIGIRLDAFSLSSPLVATV